MVEARPDPKAAGRSASGSAARLTAVRDATERYLDVDPPAEQALQLHDVIRALVSLSASIGSPSGRSIVVPCEE